VTYLNLIGWLYWLEGRDHDMRMLAEEIAARANDREWPVVRLARQMLQALILITDHDWVAAEPMLHALHADQQQFRDSAVFGDAGLLLAFVYLQQGHDAEALTVLGEVLTQHRQQGTPGLVMLLGVPIVVPLMRLAVAHDVQAPFARTVLHGLRAAPDPRRATRPSHVARGTVLPDPDMLTPREIEVLQLIGTGASNSNIAERLVISPRTVKKHINNIFAKLHAQSRTHALVQARERGLL